MKFSAQSISRLPTGILLFTCAVLLFTTMSSEAALTTKSAFKVFFWTQDTEIGTKNGCYGYNQVDSIAPSKGAYHSSLWLTYTWWHQKFSVSYVPTDITFSKSKPSTVIRAPDHFSNIEWFTGFKRLNSTDSIRFYFPLLPQTQQYGRYDYFTIDVDSLCNLEFYGAGDSSMVGSFVHKKPDSRGAVNILARNAFILELTKSNPLRIKSIRCNGAYDSLLTLFLGYNLNTFKKDAAWYGIDIIDTSSNVPKISVHTVAITGKSPYMAGSSQTVSWKLEAKSEVDSCQIMVSFDNKKTWSPAGKTTTDSTFNWTIPAQVTDSAAIKIVAFGKHGERISAQSSLFAIKDKTRFLLTIQSYSNSTVVAHWNPEALSIPKKRALWIAYRPGSAVSSFTTASPFDTIRYSLTTTRDTIDDLKESSMYYFTAFVEDSSGNFTIANDDAIDSAEAKDLTPPTNNYLLDTVRVDSNVIVLSWKSDGNSNPDIDSIGIWYNKTNQPTVDNLSASIHIGTYTAGNRSDTLYKLDPDRLYYIALFPVDKNGNRADATAKSRLSVRTKPLEEGKISGIADTLNKNDTLSIFSDSLRIWSNNIETPYIDTIDFWEAPTHSGFMQSGLAFEFRYGKPPSGTVMSFSIVADSPDSPYTDKDLALYRLNTSNGAWQRDTTPLTRDPDDNRRLIFATSNLQQPFIIMIDTSAPEISFVRKDTSVCNADEAIEGVFTLSDNIENPTLSLLAGTGGSGFTNFFSTYITPLGDKNTYRYTIPAFAANECSGLRSLVVANDGRNSDTLNLSRKIKRSTNNCDDIITTAERWTPIMVTGDPQRSTIDQLMNEALDINNYTYDNTSEAIIRWEQEPDQKGTWLEYSSDSADAFTVAPGALFWIRSKRRTPLSYGTAVVPALIDTFTITLKKLAWTDFSIPYNFDIYSGDIIDATGEPKNLKLYEWTINSNTQNYTNTPVYLQGIDTLSNKLQKFNRGGAYSAKNNSNTDIILRIPPTSTSLSALPAQLKKAGIAKKTDHNQQWCIRIDFSGDSGEIFSSSYIAQKPSGGDAEWYTPAPSFSQLSATILNSTNGKMYQHAASGDLTSGGVLYPLQYSNASGTASRLHATVAFATHLPAGYSAQLYQSTDRETPQPASSLTTTLAPQQKSTGYLIIGSDAFIKNTMVTLNSNFSFTPFTANGFLKINYSLPAGVNTMKLALYDLKGRRVEEIVRTSELHAGKSSLLIQNRFAAGYYIVQMRIQLDNHNIPQTLNKRWMYVK